MTGQEINEVRYRIEEEGLRLAFVEATKNLKKYIFGDE